MARHEEWIARLGELGAATVLTTRPTNDGGRRFNEAFLWDSSNGYRSAHRKALLPNEEGFWEAEWYHKGNGEFDPINAAAACVGFQICTELWSLEHAQKYGKRGVHTIAVPRATSKGTVSKWLAGGQVAAIVAGAFSLSSNRTTRGGPRFGGTGWILSPDGDVLGLTSDNSRFATVDIDLGSAERAKATYPRYALD